MTNCSFWSETGQEDFWKASAKPLSRQYGLANDVSRKSRGDTGSVCLQLETPCGEHCVDGVVGGEHVRKGGNAHGVPRQGLFLPEGKRSTVRQE